jgi:hypothetical protein
MAEAIEITQERERGEHRRRVDFDLEYGSK